MQYQHIKQTTDTFNSEYKIVIKKLNGDRPYQNQHVVANVRMVVVKCLKFNEDGG